MVKLAEIRESEIEVVLEHMRLELQTAIDDPAFMLRRLKPIVELAFIAGYDAATNERVEREASGEAQHLDG